MIAAVAIIITAATTINTAYKLVSGAGVGIIWCLLLKIVTSAISSNISVFLYSSVL